MNLANLEFNCLTLTFNINIFILLIILLIIFLNFSNIKNRFNKIDLISKHDIEIEGGTIGTNFNIKFRPNKKDKEIAYKLWVELSTRKLGIPFDIEHDLINEVYDSWYEFFKITRNSLKEFPISKLNNNKSNEIIEIAIGVLNGELRNHLTKWQGKYRRWYEFELKDDKNKNKPPQEIQKMFPEYDELIKELIGVNECLINYKDILYEITFDKKP